MSAFNRNILRSIRDSIGRFIAIAAIVALGCGFYAGLRMTAPDMRLAADEYYDGTHLMDIRVVSTLGLTDEDIEAIQAVQGVEGVMPAYSTDVLATLEGEQYVMRVHSLSESASSSTVVDDATIESDDVNYLNRLELAEGRWPEAAGECLIFNDRVMSGPSDLGDTIIVDTSAGTGDEALNRTEFTIVGRVHSPLYVSSTSMGTSTIGSGTVQQFIYVLPEDFSPDLPYVEAYVSVEGASLLSSDSQAYQDRVDEVVSALEEMAPVRERARQQSLQAEARQELDEARSEYEAEEARVQDELAQARAKLDAAKQEIDEGQRQLDAAASTLSASESKIKNGEKDYVQGNASLEKRKADAEAQITEAQSQIKANEENLAEAQAALPGMQAALDEVNAALTDTQLGAEEIAALEARKAELEKNIADIAQAATDLEAAKQALAEQQATAAAQLEAAESSLASGKTSVEEGKRQLEEGRTSYEESKVKLDAARKDYEQGVADYDTAAAEANEKLDAAERELAEAEEKINDIAPPEWLIMDRSRNYGVVSFESDSDRIDAIASFFPFIFFLVAALVALTTMTRMVEEERMLIGTFKALGYSRARITSKYLIYAALAAGLGSILGIAVLSQVLPLVIMEAYSIVYYVPQGPTPIDWPIALSAAGLGIGITLLATWGAAFATLRETPAALMQPPAPKAGKRILLERIRPLWRHLSFSWKVTFRNIFRYKRRLFMTVIGIAGCTALLLTGLGLQNSINDIIDVQYDDLVSYNVVITEKEDATDEEKDAAATILNDTTQLSVSARATETSMIAENRSGSEVMTTLIAPEDPSAFAALWTFRTRIHHDPVSLSEGSVVVTEKLATRLGLSIGDDIIFAEQDDLGNATATTYSLPISGIIENYIGNDAFMTADTYESTFGKAPDNLTIYAQAEEDGEDRAAISEALRATGAVDTVAFNDEIIDAYKQMLKSVDMIVVVLVVAAAVLAFIVLYNLTNINISERAREIATLKVLGFTPGEVDAYIFREIVLLTIGGALLGLGLGVFLEGFVVTTAEVDQVMFGRTIHAASFVIAFILTLGFTALVMVCMRPKLSRINMVESLKSNE